LQHTQKSITENGGYRISPKKSEQNIDNANNEDKEFGRCGESVTDFLENQAEEAEEAGDLPTAFEAWKELAIKNQDPAFFIRYGSVAKKLERWEEAENAFAQALRLDPTSSLIMENMGSLWAHRSDKNESDSLENAKQWFLRALKHERHARLLTQLGATYYSMDDNTSARTAFEEAIRIDPEYEEALYFLAVLDEKTNPQKSMELLERAIQIDPDYAMAHQVLGRLSQRAKDLTRAEYHFRRSLEIDPADYWSNMYMANLLGVLGRNEEAEQAYRFATSLHPEIAGGVETFGRFLESIGKQEEAAKLRARAKRST
jgi:Tfp pilus assembly protein PilF